MPEVAGGAKLLQYLNEAYGKERELETALQAHIEMTTRMPYKKRLRQHLTETKRHGRELERRIKKISGGDGPAKIASVAGEATGRAKSLAKGPLHMVRGTSDAEKMLKNAKTEYYSEHEEIATYTAIETLAEELNDKETAKVARAIRRDEERMARFLERQIPVLTKAVVKEEVPASERRKNGARRRGSSNGGRKRTTARGRSSSRSSSNGRRKGTSSRSTSSGRSRSRTRSRS